MNLVVHATPGHCANHLAFGWGDTLLSGDHVMGWNSTLVAVPDGSMADYFQSLDKVIALPYRRYLPAHGGTIADGRGFAAALRAHRETRNKQVIEAVRGGARTIAAIVDRIYPEQAWPVRRAARMTIAAHVEYLAAQGLVTVSRTIFGLRITPQAGGG
jgi:glyoxylase-like metal-dependent hydrolase (beta-lactamase superfamily II)